MDLLDRLEKTQANPEPEKKFLVEEINIPQNLSSYEKKDIIQWYFEENWQLLRLRKQTKNWETIYFLTQKTERQDGYYDEKEIEISKQEFNNKWVLVHAILEKNRYLIPYTIWNYKYTIELDIFKWDKQWVIFAEVEFWDKKPQEHFITPEWFGREIPKVSNYKLAIAKSREEILVLLNS